MGRLPHQVGHDHSKGGPPIQIGATSRAAPSDPTASPMFFVPLLLAVSIARSWLYGTLSGLLLLFLYWVNLHSYDLPLFSVIPREPAMPGPLFGLLAWGLLVELMVKLVLRRGPSS